jgi:CubicO group peptidase (beta-lactamase class C family)
LATLEKQQNFSGGALIVRNGETILNKSYGFADREQKIVNSTQTKFRIGSITKQFTALAILLLQAQDRLNVQDSICTQLSDCPAAWQPITIHHLLTHTSGIPVYVAMSDFDRLKATPTTPLEIIARFKDEPLDFQPGERWGYSSSGYVLLSQIIEQVSGSSYEDFIQEYILTALGMNDTDFEQNPDNLAVGYLGRTNTKADLIDISNAYANGSLSSTAEDLYRWGQALYSGQLVQQELLELMFAKHVEISPGEYYGYGTVVWELSGHRVLDVGGLIDGFSTSFFHFPDDKVSMILLSNQEDVDTFNLNSELAKELFGITE